MLAKGLLSKDEVKAKHQGKLKTVLWGMGGWWGTHDDKRPLPHASVLLIGRYEEEAKVIVLGVSDISAPIKQNRKLEQPPAEKGGVGRRRRRSLVDPGL